MSSSEAFEEEHPLAIKGESDDQKDVPATVP